MALRPPWASFFEISTWRRKILKIEAIAFTESKHKAVWLERCHGRERRGIQMFNDVERLLANDADAL
ncbi:hypothetical protein [Sinorhizobium fredii]|uniref:Uncharacterized protein n=1 Tax=Rhizobium fredii TaxID=380 RepID=A0A2A6LS88_RHIFR|nr:hypothetical protein [Sinorhizobium fredii]KSV87441.1 hypothetical protein N181_18880 [Sinorhizobium fredii USDA 205]PDT45464.1 hypothetical protein CO661_23510 [Sinorhizobium fredii]GEC35285.1 hypothetical protein EFR01_54560 [Sinorhizobium fredii]GLS08586.1 hypothetical protein GCM10007864_22150 [Sinorhizobium fredii]